MENKLKTLKDLEKEQEKYDESYTIVSVDKIRQLAIKWRNNVPQLWEEWFAEYFKKKTTTKLFGEWLLDKLFNLTEEDLNGNRV